MPFSSQSAIFLSELRALLPLIVLPIQTPANLLRFVRREQNASHSQTLGKLLIVSHRTMAAAILQISCCGWGALPTEMVTSYRISIVRSEKLQNESSLHFSNFCPKFCPEFRSELAPNFLRILPALFSGKRRPLKIHQKSPPFFNAKCPGKSEENFTKVFWRAGKVSTAQRKLKSKATSQEQDRFRNFSTFQADSSAE